MNVFISWSGDTSQAVAKLLADWIRDVVQDVTCWYSPDDIEKGSMWFAEIGHSLGSHDFGILCITPENMQAPWIHFEAGALFKGLTKARVCPLILGSLTPSEITAPLSNFSLTMPTQADMLRLLKAINAGTEKPLQEDRLAKTFEVWWPTFDEGYQAILAKAPKSTVPKRSTHDLLSEILDGIRHVQRALPSSRILDDDGPSTSTPPSPPRAPAVSTRQAFSGGNEEHQSGTLYITVLRQTYTATGSGKLSPHMRDKPWLNVQLQSAPAEFNRDTTKYTCGTGTTFDFNITLKSVEYSVPLPMGEYVFAYEARILDYQPLPEPNPLSA